MNLYETMQNRRSIRAYKPEPIEGDKLARILESLRLAPSAQNAQSVRYCLITEPKLKNIFVKKACHQDFIKDAYAIVVACAKKGWDTDASIGLTHLMLAAASEGLGTCWIMWFDRRAAGEIIKVPDEYECYAIMPIGYAAESPDPKPRLPLSELVKKNSF